MLLLCKRSHPTPAPPPNLEQRRDANTPLHLPRLQSTPSQRGTTSYLPSPQLTLAMPTELAFSSVMPWFVLSPRSHIPKSCREAGVHGMPQKPSNPTQWQSSQQAPRWGSAHHLPPGTTSLSPAKAHRLPTAVL